MRKYAKESKRKLGDNHFIPPKSLINIHRIESNVMNIDFIEETLGIGTLHLFYAGKYVRTLNINLTSDMEVTE